jgi:hypothetical protein
LLFLSADWTLRPFAHAVVIAYRVSRITHRASRIAHRASRIAIVDLRLSQLRVTGASTGNRTDPSIAALVAHTWGIVVILLKRACKCPRRNGAARLNTIRSEIAGSARI